MLPATQQEIDRVTRYFEGQAPDLKVEYLFKTLLESAWTCAN